ncbi:hypothetical protein ACFUTX_12155 [Microbacterium sp. NPDC057407]|uniref:hypothetical protein n=1 Tax=Microbacterium sp. NPDC057407 TaxID=3346120 RepID=UPI00367261FF
MAITLLVAILGLVGVLVSAVISQRASRVQHAREVLFEPAREFARDAYSALAKMRGITPPPLRPGNRLPHRNEDLLADHEVRDKRVAECEEAINRVRTSRADVRLVFLPHSRAAEFTRGVLAAERDALETAVRFYRTFDLLPEAERDSWRLNDGAALQSQYIQHRRVAYDQLDRFIDDVALRVKKPTWNPRKVPGVTSG